MSPWALRRQLLFLLIPIVLFVAGGYFFYSDYLYHAPTCTDGKQDGLETGVDCGGSCSLVCSDQSIPPVVVWSKAFQVSGSVYNAVAYIQNPNNTSRAVAAPYEFRLFDNAGTLVATRQGVVDILPGKTFAVFEAGIQINGKSVKRTDFAFGLLSSTTSANTNALTWIKDTTREPVLSVTHGPIENASTTPRLSGTLTNPNLTPIGSTELVALILDGRGNTIDASKTLIDPLSPQASSPFVFTWLKPIAVGPQVCANSSKVVLALDRALDTQSIKNTEQFPGLVSSSSPQVGFVMFASTTATVIPGGFSTASVVASALQNIVIATSSPASASTSVATLGRGNNIAAALTAAGQLLTATSKNTVVVLLTAGNPTLPTDPTQGNNFPTLSAETAANTLQSQGIQVYSIGVGNGVDQPMLQAIAGSPNRAFVAQDASALPDIYRTIAASLCQTSPDVIQILSRSL